MAKKATLQGRKRINELAGSVVMEDKSQALLALEEADHKPKVVGRPKKSGKQSVADKTKVKAVADKRPRANETLKVSAHLEEATVVAELVELNHLWQQSGSVYRRQYSPRQVQEKLLDTLRGYLKERAAYEKAIKSGESVAFKSCQGWLDNVCLRLKNHQIFLGELSLVRSH